MKLGVELWSNNYDMTCFVKKKEEETAKQKTPEKKVEGNQQEGKIETGEKRLEEKVTEIETKMEEWQINEGWKNVSGEKASRSPRMQELKYGQVKIATPSRFEALSNIGENGEEIEEDKEKVEDWEKEMVDSEESGKEEEKDNMEDMRTYGSKVVKVLEIGGRQQLPRQSKTRLKFLPRGFSRSNGLMNREGEIILLNEYGKPWTALLSYYKKTGDVYLRRSWRNFCHENQKRANDLLTFKLVQEGTKPVLQLCSSMYNRGSSSTSEDRFLTLTLTHYNFRKCKLCLPATFLKANGITSARKITLVDRYGIERTTSLKPDNNYGRMRLGKGWREFCEANGVKAGESFKLELIEEEEEEQDTAATHLLKFCTKV
ncbi:hypothetical protein F2Q70_00023646 [Brassica cretica]|uniref:TF-B3 domain-containing protein n=1 Tax=Brassica cretica TaxID=69181 RepID=A0A8S9GWN5_BRACR|nr:hypothetical protein F2Q70_00023646 [Brassica cretica]